MHNFRSDRNMESNLKGQFMKTPANRRKMFAKDKAMTVNQHMPTLFMRFDRSSTNRARKVNPQFSDRDRLLLSSDLKRQEEKEMLREQNRLVQIVARNIEVERIMHTKWAPPRRRNANRKLGGHMRTNRLFSYLDMPTQSIAGMSSSQIFNQTMQVAKQGALLMSAIAAPKPVTKAPSIAEMLLEQLDSRWDMFLLKQKISMGFFLNVQTNIGDEDSNYSDMRAGSLQNLAESIMPVVDYNNFIQEHELAEALGLSDFKIPPPRKPDQKLLELSLKYEQNDDNISIDLSSEEEHR